MSNPKIETDLSQVLEKLDIKIDRLGSQIENLASEIRDEFNG